VFAASAGCRAVFPSLRTDDLQQKLAKMRESDSILIESADARANARKLILTRSQRETVTFRHPFRIKGIDRELQAGAYEVLTDDEMIEGLSFPCFRRVATMIMTPGAAPHHVSTEMISISSVDLVDAQRADAVASQ
jgi:hypothetical protein